MSTPSIAIAMLATKKQNNVKEPPMALMRRERSILPDVGSRHLFRWPDWSDLFERPFFTGDFGEELIRAEEYKENGSLVVRLEIPGVDPEKDIDVEVNNGRLCISAERKERSEKTEASFYRSEMRYGTFHREIALPAHATDEDVEATYKDGILEVRLPLEETKAEGHKIAISSG